MDGKKEKHRGLGWPWNLIVGAGIVLALGYWIGYLWSGLLAAAFLAWQKKRNPGMPEGGYCLERTRKRLSHLGLALIFLFLGLALGVYGWIELQEDKSAWEYEEYIKLAVGCLGALGFTAAGLYTGYVALRDAFWPQNSVLAKSIRSQLPYPEEAPGVGELFAMVDKDIQENGLWFDRVAVGKEWVLGDEASYIPRIRAAFGRDEIRSRQVNGRVQSSRIIELYLLDDRRQVQITTLRNPRELEPLLDCIHLRAPDALIRPYSEYSQWRQKSEEEWQRALRDYQLRQGKRETEEFLSHSAGEGTRSAGTADLAKLLATKKKKEAPVSGHLGLMSAAGVFQSHDTFTLEDVQAAGDGLIEGSYQSVDLTMPNGYLWMRIQTGDKTDGRCNVFTTRAGGDKLRYFKCRCTHRQAAAWLVEFARGTFHPEGGEWKEYTQEVEKEAKKSR